jgi:hypothetical protein
MNNIWHGRQSGRKSGRSAIRNKGSEDMTQRILGGQSVGRFGLGGDGSPENNEFPVIYAGQYTFGAGSSKEYVGSEVDVLPLEGVVMTSFRFNRPSGYAIPNADPNRDKAMYIKYTNRAENIEDSTPVGEAYGLNVEVDQRGTIGTLHGLYVYERIRDTITTCRIARFENSIGCGETVPTVFEGVRIDINNPNTSPADSCGLAIQNKETTGINTPPEAAIRIESGGSSSGWLSGIYFAANCFGSAYARPVWIHDETADIVFMRWAGAPTNGSTGAGYAGKGSLLIDYTNGYLYINTNTKASPTWTKVGTQT